MDCQSLVTRETMSGCLVTMDVVLEVVLEVLEGSVVVTVGGLVTAGGSPGGFGKGAPALGTASQAAPAARMTATMVSPAVSVVVIVVGLLTVENCDKLVATYVASQVDDPLVVVKTVFWLLLTSMPHVDVVPVEMHCAETGALGRVSSAEETPAGAQIALDKSARKAVEIAESCIAKAMGFNLVQVALQRHISALCRTLGTK